MYGKTTSRDKKRAFAVGAALLLGASLASAADSVDNELSGWLGREITVKSSTIADDFPIGGKLTFVFDDAEKVVRVCTRQSTAEKPWRSELAEPCGVTLTFTRGTRYCTVEEVKAGDAETLATCHRMRSREIALQPAAAKSAELHDLLVFLVKSEVGKPVIAILVDSPSRVTGGGVVVGGPG